MLNKDVPVEDFRTALLPLRSLVPASALFLRARLIPVEADEGWSLQTGDISVPVVQALLLPLKPPMRMAFSIPDGR